MVLTFHPLKSIWKKPQTIQRLAQISIELGEYDINFMAQSSLKAQLVIDLVVEFSDFRKII